MVEVIGDVVAPINLIVPKNEGATTLSGAGMLFLSGSKLYIIGSTDGVAKLITSA